MTDKIIRQRLPDLSEPEYQLLMAALRACSPSGGGSIQHTLYQRISRVVLFDEPSVEQTLALQKCAARELIGELFND